MSDLVPVSEPATFRTPAIVALDADAPRLADLFAFMVDAELRVETLRMRIVERVMSARGEEATTIDVALQHPGRARVTRRASEEPLDRRYDVWASDGHSVTTYDAAEERASIRATRPRVVGASRADLPPFARVYQSLTALPAETIVDTFVHPHGFIRNVLLSGPIAMVGTAMLAGGRESFILRADHPRSTQLLTDRPDRWLEVGVDRQTGFVLLLVEHIGDRVTRHAEVTSLELDPAIADGAFGVFLPADVRMIY